MSAPSPSSRPYIRQRASGPYWYAKWYRNGVPVIRALGRAWVEADDAGGWARKRGKAPNGELTEAQANARMLELVQEHHAQQSEADRGGAPDEHGLVTFRELSKEWLVYLELEKGAKPSTLDDYRWTLAEPGQPHKRGPGTSPGLLMAALGDTPIDQVTTREVSDFLRELDKSGCKPRTVNKYRQLVLAAFNYAMREDAYALTRNPASGTTKRKEPPPEVLDFYEPDEVELLASTAARGAYRWVHPLLAALDSGRVLEAAAETVRVSLTAIAYEVEVNPAFADRLRERHPAGLVALSTSRADRDLRYVGEDETRERRLEDEQDAELYRVAAFTGLRQGELRALRWGDVQLAHRRLTVHRAFSANVEGPTKSWQARYPPLSDGAADALERLSMRGRYVGQDDYVFCSRLGRPLDAAALRRRFKRAAAAAGLRVLRFHALRHGAGSLAARQADPRWVQSFLGHSELRTTERYMHAKARPEDVDRLNRAFTSEPRTRVSAALTSAQAS